MVGRNPPRVGGDRQHLRKGVRRAMLGTRRQIGERKGTALAIAIGWTLASAASALAFSQLASLALWPLVGFTIGMTIAMAGLARLDQLPLRQARTLRKKLQRRRDHRQRLRNRSQAKSDSPTTAIESRLLQPRPRIWLEFDERGLITQASADFCEWCGRRSVDLRGKHHSILNTHRSKLPLVSDLALAQARKRPWIGEFTCTSADGSSHLLSGELQYLTDRDGLGTFLLTGIDLTEHQRRINGLQLERNYLESIFHASPSAILVVDAVGRVRRANRMARKWFGPEDPVGRLLVRDLFRVRSLDGTEIERSRHPFHRIRTTGEALFDDRYRLEEAGSERRIVALYGSPFFDANGDFSGCIFNLLDLTEQAIHREAVQHYRERIELAFAGSGMGMWDWQVESGALTLCPRFAELLGHAPEQLEPRIETLTRLIHPEDLDRFMQAVRDHFQNLTAVIEVELRLRCRTGSWKWGVLRGRVVSRTPQNQPSRMIGVLADIHAARVHEAQLQEKQQLLDHVLSLFPNAVYWTDREGNLVGSNQAFRDLVQTLSAAESTEPYPLPIDLPLVALNGSPIASDRSWIQEAHLGESQEARWLKPSGSHESLILSRRLLIDPSGNPAGLIGGIEVVTKRREQEARIQDLQQHAADATRALEISRDRLAQALSATDDVLFDWDIVNDSLYLSPRWNEIVGDEIPVPQNMEHLREYVSPEDLPSYDRTRNDHLRGLNPLWEVEHRVMAPDAPIWFLTRARITECDIHGSSKRMVGTLVDITHRKEAEEELKRIRSRFNEAVESIDSGLVMFDREHRLVLANRRFRELYPEIAEFIVPGMRFEELLRTTGERIPELCEGLELEEWIAQSLELRRTNVNEWLQQLPQCWVRVADRETPDGGFVSLRTDITQEYQAQQELARAREAAEVANQAKSEFLANMSHEIRTPMTAILGFADLLLEDDSAASRSEYVQTIRRNGQHLLSIINDILDLSKIESGNLELESIPFNLRRLIEDVVQSLQVRVQGSTVRLFCEFADDSPTYLVADPTRLRQVITNLVGNAAKFTEQGYIKVRVSREAERSTFMISVTDTGIGISAESLTKLFQPFQQADASSTRRFGGTGLGLTISRRLCGRMGGDISVTSEENVGSCFEIRLPCLEITEAESDVDDLLSNDSTSDRAGELQLSRVTQPDALRTLEATSIKGDGESARGSDTSDIESRRLRILIAEDGPDNRRLLGVLLNKLGCMTKFVEDGAQAVDELIARDRDYDLMLLDMQMPVMDGYTAARRIRELGFELPIIALTAHTMAGDDEKCLAAGCTSFLGKPIDRRRLAELVNQYSTRNPLHES